jgi:ribonuclease HI
MYQGYYKIKLYSCGGCLWSFGPGAIGFVVCDERGDLLEKDYWGIKNTTYHRASYLALVESLKFVTRFNPTLVYCYLENKLVAYQLKGWWTTKSAELQMLKEMVVGYEKHFAEVYYNLMKDTHPKIDEVCFVSAKFGPLMIFLKLWFGYTKTTHGGTHEYQEEAIA